MLHVMSTHNQKYYSQSYKTSISKNINTRSASIIHAKLKNIPFSKENKVLDVACGISTLGKMFGDHVYGFDINKESLIHAKNNGIVSKFGNVEKKWKYPNNSFDIVIASHIIEHVVNPDYLLLETKRVLKKDGLLIIATPNLAAWFNRILLLLGIQPFFTEVSTLDKTLGLTFTRKFTPLRSPLGHLRVFTYQALKDLLEFHKFSLINSYGMEFVPFPATLLFIDKILSRFVSIASTFIIVARNK